MKNTYVYIYIYICRGGLLLWDFEIGPASRWRSCLFVCARRWLVLLFYLLLIGRQRPDVWIPVYIIEGALSVRLRRWLQGLGWL